MPHAWREPHCPSTDLSTGTTDQWLECPLLGWVPDRQAFGMFEAQLNAIYASGHRRCAKRTAYIPGAEGQSVWETVQNPGSCVDAEAPGDPLLMPAGHQPYVFWQRAGQCQRTCSLENDVAEGAPSPCMLEWRHAFRSCQREQQRQMRAVMPAWAPSPQHDFSTRAQG